MTTRWWARVTAFITLAAAWKLLAPTVADPDLWGHILFGQRTLAMGIERVDPFSYLTAGHGWINHEWLSEVTFAAVFDAAGAGGLIALKLVIALATVGLVYRHLVRRGSDPLRAGLLLLPAIMLMIPGFSTVRPQMFTFLFFALTLYALFHIEAGEERWLWALPPILGVWINFHGGVLAGAGMMGIWGIARAARAFADQPPGSALAELRKPILAGLAAAAALLANPYGWGLPRFLLETATVPRPDIMEWQPLDISSAQGVIYLALVATAIVTIARSRLPRSPAMLALIAALVVLPLTAIRHLQLFGIGLPLLIADHFAEAWRRREAPPAAGRAERLVVGGVTVAAGTLLLALGVRDSRCIVIDPQRSIPFPVAAVEIVRDAGAQGEMATYFDWGEYVIWHLYPDIKVSMDGRRETVYPDSIYREYLSFQMGLEGWRGVIDRPETDFVLFSKLWPAFQLVDLDPGWEKVYEDPIGGLFARSGHPAIPALRAATPRDLPASGAGMCVPRQD